MSEIPPSSIFGLGRRAPAPDGAGDLPAVPGLRFEGVLGSGATGTVIAAHDLGADRPVAVKILHAHWRGTGNAERFADEIEALGSLRHRNIARVHRGGVLPDGRAYCVIERIDGAPLTTGAEAAGLSMRRRIEILVGVADALAHAHSRRILHRDLKPANILLGRDGRAQIVDFGLSLALDPAASRRTLPGSAVGTTEYMSPEQRAGIRDLDERSDVFSLAVVSIELLTGIRITVGDHVPEEGGEDASGISPAARRRAIDRLTPNLARLLATASEPDRAARLPDARRFADDLRRVLAHLPVTARPVGTFTRLRLFHARHRVETWILAGAVLIFAIALSLSADALLRSTDERRDAAELRRRTTEVLTSLREELLAAGEEIPAPLEARLEEIMHEGVASERKTEEGAGSESGPGSGAQPSRGTQAPVGH